MLCFPLLIFGLACGQDPTKTLSKKTQQQVVAAKNDLNFDSLVSSIKNKREAFKAAHKAQSLKDTINNFWVDQISNNLYSCWKGTAWNFNGHTTQPRTGAIACGYFVTTMLVDMDVKINRSKLAICPSSEMMKSLVGAKSIMNLSRLDSKGFHRKVMELGKGVYIIGLDFHTGFIVNDGQEILFIHSCYVQQVGVIKEPVLTSVSLNTSKTKWLISLSRNITFQEKWLR